MKNIIIIGFGPHFKKSYFQYIFDLYHKKALNIVYIIDLQNNKKDIYQFLKHYNMEHTKQIMLPVHII